MALVLNIETATTNCSVSLSKDGETLVLKEDNSAGYSHAETLHVYIKDVFAEANISSKDIDAVAVSKGPGSYTGLRIGVSSAKGLCYALSKPLISVSTLESLAHQVKADDGVIIPMLDARRMEVYSAIFNHKYEQVREIKAEVLTEESYIDLLKDNKVYFVGSGVAKTKELLNHPNAIFVEDKLPSANEMSLLSELKYKKSDIEDVAYFEPYYLKDFVAVKKKV
ncbi:tRNA (adenosine(37)-N6)-threonylcarbamoyltransferase complex dimerization subunit type 1 TsaB [Winogradskyella marincola]|uniref:tRNA (Adenosine(37)-N6)-threonylcarbamoyltransferase complex dimerization subunit type 1 TsaB n=1 Tax=Winogradskyella marincola TaxID=3037795 RepID=A0ABT6FYM2_9FLAO|nr:tRNA (adenosine(37)-N6)-threonylcarbamoyltransferase complex dimerization subunit type 1 TsaB [Winogradskyella sp. YYF002]MDG4714890.1 tRNA (adenosine(37)-N6)-threonylcarbamoyltransferase complex dimerization subunit type 1 TsaB [Winogradskyella sp. YYF002]